MYPSIDVMYPNTNCLSFFYLFCSIEKGSGPSLKERARVNWTPRQERTRRKGMVKMELNYELVNIM